MLACTVWKLGTNCVTVQMMCTCVCLPISAFTVQNLPLHGFSKLPVSVGLINYFTDLIYFRMLNFQI